MTLTNKERKIAGLPLPQEIQEIITEEMFKINFPLYEVGFIEGAAVDKFS